MSASSTRTRSPTSSTSRNGAAHNAAGATLRDFARFTSRLILPNLQPAILIPAQRTMLAEHFAGAIETLLLLPKKNTKTTTLAELGLFALMTCDDADIPVVATSRDQATLLLDEAIGFVRRTPGLERHIDIKRGYRELRARHENGGRLRVLAADVDTADGITPWPLALVDELHRARSAELYAVLRAGLEARGAQMVAISTAGTNTASPLGVMRRAAYRLPIVERNGAHRRAAAADGSYVMHEWALDPTDDVDDMRVVKRANPAPWHTLIALQRRHDSPSMTSWTWRRFACNLWQATADPWLPAGAWDAIARPDLHIPARAPAWLAVFRHKETGAAIVAVAHDPKRRDGWACWSRILRPDRGPVALADIEEAVRTTAVRFDVQACMFDPQQFTRSAELLEAEGIFMVPMPNTNARMAPASDTLYQAIVSGDLVHDGDDQLAAHVDAGETIRTERGWRLTARGVDGDVEALMALTMALDAATRGLEPPRRRYAIAI
jgi:phage terminase large subunit-like protein